MTFSHFYLHSHSHAHTPTHRTYGTRLRLVTLTAIEPHAPLSIDYANLYYSPGQEGGREGGREGGARENTTMVLCLFVQSMERSARVCV